ncbi:conjugal transfer mating-pair stabilization protein TraG [Pectobacterium aroidearum]|uniref:conjugal transfer mating-pair stabilization protein TraG n=1 Tax=Pectobacterium aroidearum TaxID=1201031 RepID=UPI003018DE24
MTEVYLIAGGEWMRNNLNAIAAFMSTQTWASMEKLAVTLSVLVVGVLWVQRHNIMDMLGWVVVFLLVTILVGVRVPVQIIDNSDLVKVYKVDNVPVGLALPFSLTTKIGRAMILSYEYIFALPDSLTYSKTGMLFGASMVAKSTDFISKNPDITTLFQDYVQNCVMGDIFLNHKYSLEELMNSDNPYALIFRQPSPLRQVPNNSYTFLDKDKLRNSFISCKDASVVLKQRLGLDTQSGGMTYSYYVRKLFGGRPDANALFAQMLGESYSHFYGASQSASDIVRKNVTINALRNGITSYASRNGDAASLLNIATTSSLEKQRLSQASIGQIAMRTLPLTQVILTGIAVSIFPMMVMAAVFNKLTIGVIKGYVFALIWLQTWPLLYAVLNSAMTFYARQTGGDVVLSEFSQIQLKYSDLAATAGYISIMIPPLSWAMVKGLGAGFSSVYSHFASSATGPTAGAAGSAVDGNYSYSNMQTENVNGFSWNTNSNTTWGQMSYQTGTGASMTQTRDGTMVSDSTQAMSKLPVGINATQQIAAAQQAMAREASAQAESALHGFSSSITSAWNTLSQWGSNRGNSDSVTQGADTSQSSQDTLMASKMRSAVESYAKSNNISYDQATQELASRSTRASAGMYADAYAEGKLGLKILGTGGGLGAKAGGRVSIDGDDTDRHEASSTSRGSNGAGHDTSARATQDFKEGMDYFTSRKLNTSGSHTDNNAASRVDQLSAQLNSAKQSYDQYTSSSTRSHEYAEMASRTESMSGQMSEDLSQQFVNYVNKHAPNQAEAVLTNTSSPEVAEMRRKLAWSFVQEQVQPGVDNTWQDAKGGLGQSMAAVPHGAGEQDLRADNAANKDRVDAATQSSGIQNNVGGRVDGMIKDNRAEIEQQPARIRDDEKTVDNQYNELKNYHTSESAHQNAQYNKEKASQTIMPEPGQVTPDNLLDRSKEMNNGKKK